MKDLQSKPEAPLQRILPNKMKVKECHRRPGVPGTRIGILRGFYIAGINARVAAFPRVDSARG